MADRPPPSRYSVVERGGRLVVVDRETGLTPPTAAERMAEHDRRMGNEPIRPAPRQAPAATPATAPQPSPAEPAAPKQAQVPSRKGANRPWATATPAKAAQPRSPRTPAPVPDSQRTTIVTGKWWDAKGPRTIELGPRGRQVLTQGFLALLGAAAVAAVLLLLISPVALFVAAFLLFRWGGGLLGPLGASIVDKALAEKT